MNTNTLSFIRYVLLGVTSFCMLLAPFFVYADSSDEREHSRNDRSELRDERRELQMERREARLCRIFSSRPFLPVPDICDDDEEEPETPTLSLAASPATVTEGDTTTISWNSEHADTCTASDGWSGTKATDGMQEVTVLATTTYTLTCTGEGGEVSKSVVVGAVEDEAPAEEPTVSITANPTILEEGGTTTLTWESSDATSCEASGAWTGAKAIDGSEVIAPTAATSTYTIECTGPGGSADDSVTVLVDESDEEPEPTLTHLLISEVYYDLANDGSHGSETGGANEWVELYNPTDADVDLTNWEIGDGSSNDVISATEFILGPGEYLVVTNATSTANFWDLETVTVVFLGSSISGGLANGGDSVKLYDASETLVDAMSYGSNVSAFDPSVAVVPEGSSATRADLTVDTDTAADWEENESPTPGF